MEKDKFSESSFVSSKTDSSIEIPIVSVPEDIFRLKTPFAGPINISLAGV